MKFYTKTMKKKSLAIGIISFLAISIVLFFFTIPSHETPTPYHETSLAVDNVSNDSISTPRVSAGTYQDVGASFPWNISFKMDNSQQSLDSLNDFALSGYYDGYLYNQTAVSISIDDLYAPSATVDNEIVSDDALVFDDNYLNYEYAMSFEVPLDCYLDNFSMFIQYPGGYLNWNGQYENSSFYMKIYNATDSTGVLLPDTVLTSVFVNQTENDFAQPSQWFTANTTGLFLNVSETVNNTFYAVIEIYQMPNSGGFGSKGYIYYANDTTDDEYNGTVLVYDTSVWTQEPDIDLLLKTGFSPVSHIPTCDEMNMSINDVYLDATGIYTDTTFRIPDSNLEFFYNVSSPWFAPLQFNISYTQTLTYRYIVESTFTTSIDENMTIWEQENTISEFPTGSYDNEILIVKPSYWIYNSSTNGTTSVNPLNVSVSPDNELLTIVGAANNLWHVVYNQTYNFTSVSLFRSVDKSLWYNLSSTSAYVNFTDYLNFSAAFPATEGNTRLSVYNGLTQLKEYEETSAVSTGAYNFSLWRMDQNTSLTLNASSVYVDIVFYNSTFACIHQTQLTVVTVDMDITHVNETTVIKKDLPALEIFYLNNSLNGENITLSSYSVDARTDNLSIVTDNDAVSAGWNKLIEGVDFEWTYLDLLNGGPSNNSGLYNLTLLTDSSFFWVGTYQLRVKFLSTYFNTVYYYFNVTITSRTSNVTFIGADHDDFIYHYEDIAKYTFFINDSETGSAVKDMSISVYANFTTNDTVNTNETVWTALTVGEYTVIDFENGTYEIDLYNEMIYKERDIENVTLNISFYKEGIYEISSNYSLPLNILIENHSVSVVVLNTTANEVSLSDDCFLVAEVVDVVNNQTLTGATLIVMNGTQNMSRDFYFIEAIDDGVFRITFLLDKMPLGTYNITFDVILPILRNVTYYLNQSLVGHYDFVFIPETMSLSLGDIPALPFNSTENYVLLNVTWELGFLQGITIYATLGPNELTASLLSVGQFKIFLDTTGLLPDTSYPLIIRVEKEKFYNMTLERSAVIINRRVASLVISQEFLNFSLYQEESKEIFVVVKDAGNGGDVFNATLTLQFENADLAVFNASPLAKDFSWYSFTINPGDIPAGTYNAIITMTHPLYYSTSTNITITVLQKRSVEINITKMPERWIEGSTETFVVTLSGNPEDIANRTLQAVFTIQYDDGRVEEKTIPIKTDENGVASFQFTLPENIKDVSFEVVYPGNVEVYTKESQITQIPSISQEELQKEKLIEMSPYIGAAAAASVAVLSIRRSHRKKIERHWKEIFQIYEDAANIKHVLVIEKNSGTTIISQSLLESHLDDSLISGFLTAITAFGSEISARTQFGKNGDASNADQKDNTEDSDKTMRISKNSLPFTLEPPQPSKGAGKKEDKNLRSMDYGEFKILLYEGNYTRTALFLESTPSKALKEQLKKFVQKIEKDYEAEFKNWKGNLKKVAGIAQIITDMFGLYLLLPYRLPATLPKAPRKLTSLEQSVISTAKYLLKSRDHLFLSQILENLIAATKRSKEEIFSAIYECVNMNLLEIAIQ